MTSEAKLTPMRPAILPKKAVPSVKDMIAQAIPMIGSYAQLDNQQQAVALIDEVRGQRSKVGLTSKVVLSF